MHRLAVVAVFLVAVSAVAQNPPPTSDPQAISLAQQSVAALTGGVAVNDITLNGNAISTWGSDNESGTAMLEAKGTAESRVDLNLSGGTRSDVRNITSGVPAGAWNQDGGSATAYAQHNCWIDAAWFFPALSSLTQAANPNFIFKYIGQEQHGGVSVQHIRVFQIASYDSGTLQRLSTTNFYLDVNTNLPLAIGARVHADNDMNTDLSTEGRFADYRPVNGIQVPFRIQKLLNGVVVLDVTITTAAYNTGLPDSVFSLQ